MEWHYFGNGGYLVVGIVHLDESILSLTFQINMTFYPNAVLNLILFRYSTRYKIKLQNNLFLNPVIVKSIISII